MSTNQNKGTLISSVDSFSISEEVGIEPGDRLFSINGVQPRDIIDYRWLSSEELLLLLLEKSDGDWWEIEIEKDRYEPLGLHFDPPTIRKVRKCGNQCVFCFVDQNPPGMRETVYFKDDDYLLSFLEGHYITLNSLSPQELDRIVEEKLSPLYVSIHTTDSHLRCSMMRSQSAAMIKDRLTQLTSGGVLIHGQIVLCPEWNDGNNLEQTLWELASLGTNLQSLSVVPVGLTSHREGLTPLRPLGEEEAREILSLVHRWQEDMLKTRGTRFVFAADELYLKSGYPLPSDQEYEDYPQLSNGVGMLRLLEEDLRDWNPQFSEGVSSTSLQVTLVTGKAAGEFINRVAWKLEQLNTNLRLQVIEVPNRFFGSPVNVSGLLTGNDLLQELQGKTLGEGVIFPRLMLKEMTASFLDHFTPEDLSSKLGVPFIPAGDLEELLSGVEELAQRRGRKGLAVE